MSDWRRDRLGAAKQGENPTVIARMRSGYAVIGDYQFLPGYCVLISDSGSESLNALSAEDRLEYLLDTTIVGDAIISVCNPLRINYSTLMNQDHMLHTHIEARYAWEPEENRKRPTYFYPKEQRWNPEVAFSETKHGKLKRDLSAAIEELMHAMS